MIKAYEDKERHSVYRYQVSIKRVIAVLDNDPNVCSKCREGFALRPWGLCHDCQEELEADKKKSEPSDPDGHLSTVSYCVTDDGFVKE